MTHVLIIHESCEKNMSNSDVLMSKLSPPTIQVIEHAAQRRPYSLKKKLNSSFGKLLPVQ